MIVAGLDVATTTGVCLGEPGQTPQFLSRDLGQGKPHELRFSNAMRLAHELISDHGVEAIGIEEPIINPKRDSKEKLRLLFGLVSSIQGWAALKGVPCVTFEVGTIDKHFVGAKLIGRDNRKRAIMGRCQMLGWNPQSFDESDAGAVFDIMCAHQSPSYAAQSGLLLSRRTG
ncbi:hypothetical protein QEZ52_00410 [Aliisedimentitalea scapharcae]|uniref:Holliday junction resolvase RuvC n=1 Tax=Aliisedimentitalea scapharcae TaxID=1524259 RepID=A0ABZ2XWM5_9RHOB